MRGRRRLRRTRRSTAPARRFRILIYSKWFDEYNKLHPNVRINYQSQGSGAGIRQVTKQTVFFGATDGPMTDEQLQAAPGKILHFPTVLGAVVPVYNIPECQRRAEVQRATAGGHLPRQDHEMERRRRSPSSIRASTCPPRTSPSSIARMARARPTSGRTTWRRSRRSGRRRSASGSRRTGRLASAAKATKAWPASSRRPRLDRVRRTDLRHAEQDQLRRGSEHGRRIRARRASNR